MRKSLLVVSLFISVFSFAQNQKTVLSFDETTVRQKMKAEGLSDTRIRQLIEQRKEMMKRGTANWTAAKKNPAVNSSCNMGVENGWDIWQWQIGTNSGANPPVWSAPPASNPQTPNFTVTSGAGIDSNSPGPNPGDPTLPVVCPFFGNHSIKL